MLLQLLKVNNYGMSESHIFPFVVLKSHSHFTHAPSRLVRLYIVLLIWVVCPASLVELGLPTLPWKTAVTASPLFKGIHVAHFYFLWSIFFISSFFWSILSSILRFMASNYPFAIFITPDIPILNLRRDPNPEVKVHETAKGGKHFKSNCIHILRVNFSKRI